MNGENYILAEMVGQAVHTVPLDRHELLLSLLVQLGGNPRLPAEELDHPDDAHHFKCIEDVSGRLPTIPPPD